jgi:hypothetical protein
MKNQGDIGWCKMNARIHERSFLKYIFSSRERNNRGSRASQIFHVYMQPKQSAHDSWSRTWVQFDVYKRRTQALNVYQCRYVPRKTTREKDAMNQEHYGCSKIRFT